MDSQMRITVFVYICHLLGPRSPRSRISCLSVHVPARRLAYMQARTSLHASSHARLHMSSQSSSQPTSHRQRNLLLRAQACTSVVPELCSGHTAAHAVTH
eukprot:6115773-Pleurochrysis_carterae.AAC.2